MTKMAATHEDRARWGSAFLSALVSFAGAAIAGFTLVSSVVGALSSVVAAAVLGTAVLSLDGGILVRRREHRAWPVADEVWADTVVERQRKVSDGLG
jgi:hypothetical protein